MATEDKPTPSLSPQAQKELARRRSRLGKNEKGAFNTTRNWTGFKGKTLWDWLNLLAALAIPIAIALGTTWFSYQQNQTSLQIAEGNRQNDFQLAYDQQQEATLKSYLDDMSDLLLNHNLHNSKPSDEVRQVARERTLVTLRRLLQIRPYCPNQGGYLVICSIEAKANRNRIVLQFLQDVHLIGMKNAIIDLSHADLSGDDLLDVNLSHVDLSSVDMSDATLNFANLSDTNLSNADLSNTNLGGAIGADFSKVKSLHDATMPDGSIHP